MLPSPAQIGAAARIVARRAALSLAGAALMTVALGFLSAAIWIVMAEAFDGFAAALLLGGLYLGAGLLLLGLARAAPAPHLPGPAEQLDRAAARGGLHTPRGDFPPVLEAFLFGLDTALRLRRKTGRGGKRR